MESMPSSPSVTSEGFRVQRDPQTSVVQPMDRTAEDKDEDVDTEIRLVPLKNVKAMMAGAARNLVVDDRTLKTMQLISTEVIHFVIADCSYWLRLDNKKTVRGKHFMMALKRLGFDAYIGDLEEFRAQIAGKQRVDYPVPLAASKALIHADSDIAISAREVRGLCGKFCQLFVMDMTLKALHIAAAAPAAPAARQHHQRFSHEDLVRLVDTEPLLEFVQDLVERDTSRAATPQPSSPGSVLSMPLPAVPSDNMDIERDAHYGETQAQRQTQTQTQTQPQIHAQLLPNLVDVVDPHPSSVPLATGLPEGMLARPTTPNSDRFPTNSDRFPTSPVSPQPFIGRRQEPMFWHA